jgi:hypothetical protein
VKHSGGETRVPVTQTGDRLPQPRRMLDASETFSYSNVVWLAVGGDCIDEFSVVRWLSEARSLTFYDWLLGKVKKQSRKKQFRASSKASYEVYITVFGTTQ